MSVGELPGSLTWSETRIASEFLYALTPKYHMKKYIWDKSGLVKGEKLQVIEFPEIDEVEMNDVGLNGEVTYQAETPSNVTLTIDQVKEASRKFPDPEGTQSKVDRKRSFVRMAGDAAGKVIENFILALETGNTDTNDIAGDLDDSAFLTAWADLNGRSVPATDRATLMSTNQSRIVMLEDKYTNLDFVGPTTPKKTPLQSGLIPALYGSVPLWSPLVRRRTIAAQGRTINMMFHKQAYGIAVQRAPTTNKDRVGIADVITIWLMYGGVITRDLSSVLMRTTGL